MNLLEPFFAEASRRSERTAIVAGSGETASYATLLERSATLAASWRMKGIGAGDRVLLALPLGLSLYVSLIALWRLGAVIVFPEPALGRPGLVRAVEATRPRAVLAEGWLMLLRYALPELRRIPITLSPQDTSSAGDLFAPVGAGHPALISFTSGSTGRPKAIVRTHGFLTRQNECVANILRSRNDEIDLVAFPVFVLANLALGITSVLPNWNLKRHDAADPAKISRHIAQHRVTRALVPPSICEKLSEHPPDGLTAIFTGGGPAFPDMLERLCSAVRSADIVTVYGSTEAEPIAHQRIADIGAADWEAMKSGAGLLAGAPDPAIRMKLIADEIVVTGGHVNKGYLDPADERAAKLSIEGDIWHRTGDAGRLDESGRLWLLGRCDGKAGGMYPFGVEAAARFWPGVRRAALLQLDTHAVLAIEGDARRERDWQRAADRLGALRVVAVTRMPLDKRHRSKVDYPSLRKRLGAAQPAQHA